MGLKGIDFTKSKEFIPGPGAYAPNFNTLKEHHTTVR
jgi:hypothetical protein